MNQNQDIHVEMEKEKRRENIACKILILLHILVQKFNEMIR